MQTTVITPSISATPRRKLQTRFVIAGALVLGAITFLMISSFQSNAMYYLTVPELKTQAQTEGTAFYNRIVRVSGPLHKESIDWNARTMTLKFHIDESGDMFPIAYVGLVPDTLQNGETVVVEGTYTRDGIFNATNILVKCPSKYEAEEN
jgi:cytochrome c-type biogenesis protein CcmE